MGSARTAFPARSYLHNAFAFLALLFLVTSSTTAQTAKPASEPDSPIAQELAKYPGLPAEFAQLFAKLQQDVHFPAPRTGSRILALLPPGTVAYIALPNYGPVAAQTAKTFRQELQDSPVLHDWWTHSKTVAENGPKLLAALDQFAQLHDYLGDEIIFSAAMDIQEPTFLLVSEIRKPGLQPALKQLAAQISGDPKKPMRVIDEDELAVSIERPRAQEPIILVRPDFVVLSLDLATLRAFNAQLNKPKPEFATTPFGQRITREYKNGVTVLGAANVGKILDKTSPALKKNDTFQHSGFEDMQYLVWDHTTISGKAISQMELDFASPRYSAAAWLAKPAALGSLEFASPKPLLVATFVLANPAKIFDDAKDLAALSHSDAFAAVPGFEQMLQLSLKDDLLNLLAGEITFELDSFTPPHPAWRATLAVKDANHLQQTLNTLTTVAHLSPEHNEDDGITYNTIEIPAAKNPTAITYAFADGYMLIGSSRDAVADAIQLHRSGGSLAKSPKFLASFLPGHPLEASALFYEDPLAALTLQAQSLPPDLAKVFAQVSHAGTPIVLAFFGEDSAIRQVSNSSTFDAAGVLIVAAIAIPNLLRSRMAANEATAVGSLRTINTAQITYSATFPKRNYAPNLASLGPDPSDPNKYSPEHAGLIDATLGNPKCVADAWCTKSGYNFKLTSICKLQSCKDYVAAATPVSSSTGTRSFCTTSDGLIRFKLAAPLSAPVTISDCKTWQPLK